MMKELSDTSRLTPMWGGMVHGERQMDAFREVIVYCSLRDLGFHGNTFTWYRGNNPSTIVTEVVYFPIYRSDHAPILLKAGNNMVFKKGDK
ncbi:Carbamoyl-phosphate synthase large chain [Bienertia sinuspersici]